MHVSVRKLEIVVRKKSNITAGVRKHDEQERGPRQVLTNFMSAVCGCVGDDGRLPQRSPYICLVDRPAAGKEREGGRKVVIRGGSPL